MPQRQVAALMAKYSIPANLTKNFEKSGSSLVTGAYAAGQDANWQKAWEDWIGTKDAESVKSLSKRLYLATYAVDERWYPSTYQTQSEIFHTDMKDGRVSKEKLESLVREFGTPMFPNYVLP